LLNQLFCKLFLFPTFLLQFFTVLLTFFGFYMLYEFNLTWIFAKHSWSMHSEPAFLVTSTRWMRCCPSCPFFLLVHWLRFLFIKSSFLLWSGSLGSLANFLGFIIGIAVLLLLCNQSLDLSH
jgi:hypothetical protein